MYTTLLLVHILSAMVWVGGGFVMIANERHAHKTGGPQTLFQVMRYSEWTDDWVFTPAPLLVVVTGVTMVIVNDAWSFSQPWVYLAITLLVAEFSFGYRDYKRVKAASEHGPESHQFRETAPAYLRFAQVAIALLAAVVALMVFKPGA